MSENTATIAGIGEAFPEHYYTQEEMLQELSRVWQDSGVDLRKLARLHRHTTVEGRYLALPLEAYERLGCWGEANNLWIQSAEELGERAARSALAQAGCDATDVDYLCFVSVTGLSTPSIDALLVNRLGLPARVKRLPIFGLGCVAGAAGLARCADLVEARPRGVVMLVSVELCSLTIHLDDLSPANMIATGLFGDGAAAVVLVGDGKAATGPTIVASRSVLYPGTEQVMGWEISERGFDLILSPEIPRLIGEHLGEDVDEFLREQGLQRSDIRRWMVHTGGPKIFSAIEEALALPATALAVSRDKLRAVGNISSASVLQVLKQTSDKQRPQDGAYGLLFAVGPGFCCELVLVRW
ncbi:MAG: type III polyketide synthase [Acidobacteriota bacterium]